MPGLFNKMTAEDLKALGFDPQEIKDIKSGMVSETKIQELINASQTSMMDAMKNQFAELETKLTNGRKSEERREEKPELDSTEFFVDPVTNIKRLISEGTQDVRQHSMQMAADMAYSDAQRSLPHFKLQAIADEVKVEWDKYPIQYKTNPSLLVRNIYDMVVGRHLDEIRMDSDKRDGRYNLFQSGGPNRVSNDTHTSQKPEDLLTPEELKAAKSFDMTPEEYAKNKGGMKYVS